MPTRVNSLTTPFTAPTPPTPLAELEIEAPSDLPQYQIKHSVVGCWYQDEVVNASEIGDAAEIARLLQTGAIGPVDRALQGAAPISRAAAEHRTGAPPMIVKPSTEQIVAAAVAAAFKESAKN